MLLDRMAVGRARLRLALVHAASISMLGALGAACHPNAPTARTTTEVTMAKTALFPTLEASFARWEAAGASGDGAHRERLERLVEAVRAKRVAGSGAEIVFVCTHNSRRSHITQLLALAAARRARLTDVRTYSGGTEITAFHPSAVRALERVGLAIARVSDPPNPRYRVTVGPSGEAVVAFSKRYSDPPNPSAGFVVVMTCTQADAACPLVAGATARIAIPYDDPKVSDGTPEETATYDARVEQIGRDMAWVFREIARSSGPAR